MTVTTDRPPATSRDARIRQVRARPLLLQFRQPYFWAMGKLEHITTVLVEIETEGGVVGFGEAHGAPDARAIAKIVRTVSADIVGTSVLEVGSSRERLLDRFYVAGGPNLLGLGSQVVAGIEMALWDAAGKSMGVPVYQLLAGGPVRRGVDYFGFIQGDTSQELAKHAQSLLSTGFHVLYLKVGRGMETDMENVSAVRSAIGSARLRLDGNEAWDPLMARRMIQKLAAFDPEFIEQPIPRGNLEELAAIRRIEGVPIAVDQGVASIKDVHAVARLEAADVIVLSLHETGGLIGLKHAASAAAAAGLNICLHGTWETGITTTASLHAAATLTNLDDGNQIMQQLLRADLVAEPSLDPIDGQLGLPAGSGFGFVLNHDVLEKAARDYESFDPQHLPLDTRE